MCYEEMEEESKKGRLALERNLQKAFKALQSVNDVVQNTAGATLPQVKTVANLLGQYECCATADSSTLSFAADLPYFRGCLLAKIREEIDQKVRQLESMIEVLKEKQEVMSKFCETSWSLLRKYSSSLDMASLCADSPTCSLADMVEWLETVDTLLYQQYWSKVQLLEMVMTGEEAMSDSLVQRWTDQDDVLMDTIKDYLTKVEMFVAEKR